MRVKQRVCRCLQVAQHQALKHLHGNGCKGNRSIVVQRWDFGFFGNWNDGGWLEASRDFALAERVDVDFTENWGKLFCTELQCLWWDIVWASCFPDIYLCEEIFNLPRPDSEGRWWETWIRVWGHSLRKATVAWSFGGVLPVESAVEVIQLIWEGGVIVFRRWFLFILGDMLEALPHSMAVGCWELFFQVYFCTVLSLFW